MDMIAEITKMFIRIIFMCAFGEDLTDLELDYIEGFKTTKKTLPFVLRNVF
jgi:hypothetical protein